MVIAGSNDYATPRSRRDKQMSAPQYRKVAAIALAAGLGLGLAACSTKSDGGSTAGGKIVITVDCQPVGAQKDLLANWNGDVLAFQKLHPDISINTVPEGTQCVHTPDLNRRP